jgi:spore coat polysaccharide biosynthesis protein SpsF
MFIIIIQARMGSTRLPGKIMKKLLDKEIILWSYDRCLLSIADDIIIATSTNKENDLLENFLKEKNIKIFRGSENDLLDRYYQVTKQYDNNDLKIIRITSDCPFVDTNMINNMIDFYNKNNYDYIINHSPNAITPEGSGIEIFNMKCLNILWENNNNPQFREHATGMLCKTTQYDNIINKGYYDYKPNNIDINKYKLIKISIDTEEDYKNAISIVNFFNSYNFNYEEILLNYEKIFT